jgi:multiple sugar transport system permease protein
MTSKSASRHNSSMKEQRLAYILVAPVCLILIGIIGYPLVYSLALSLSSTTLVTPGEFIGLGNYIRLFQQALFWQVTWNSVIYTASTLVLKTVLGLWLAILLTKVPARTLFQALLFLPWVIPSSLSSLMWWWLYNGQFGIINQVLKVVGMTPIPWLADPTWARLAVIVVNTWRGLPFFAMCFLAGLLAIPSEFYEAAQIDGASQRAQFQYITLPLLKPIMLIVFLYSLVTTLADFEIIYIITKGGPLEATHLYGTIAFQVGLVGTRIGEGAAISLFVFPALAVSAYFLSKFIIGRSTHVN